MSDNPRERARKRLDAWWRAQANATPRVTQEQLGGRIGWRQNEVSRLIQRGPLLEELDLVSTMTGLPVSYFVVADDAAALSVEPTTSPLAELVQREVSRQLAELRHPFQQPEKPTPPSRTVARKSRTA